MAFRYHSTSKQFVGAFRSAVVEAFIPYVASAILLTILDSELRAWVETKRNEYMTDVGEFHHLCDHAIDRARFTVLRHNCKKPKG